MQTGPSTIDDGEVAKFEAMAAEWWDPQGKFKPLHMLNPTRLDYITGQIAAEFGRDLSQDRPFSGLRVLDIGCGGGLLCEPVARLGATVVGADAAPRNIPVAQVHAAQSGLDIDYRHTTAEALAATGETFDVVLNMEVVEHVADPQAYLTACHDLLTPAGCTSARPSIATPEVLRWPSWGRNTSCAGCPGARMTGRSSSRRTSFSRCCARPGWTRWIARGSPSTPCSGPGRSPNGTCR